MGPFHLLQWSSGPLPEHLPDHQVRRSRWIFVPESQKLAQKSLNPRLCIQDVPACGAMLKEEESGEERRIFPSVVGGGALGDQSLGKAALSR